MTSTSATQHERAPRSTAEVRAASADGDDGARDGQRAKQGGRDAQPSRGEIVVFNAELGELPRSDRSPARP
jgi:hypothetical protein